MKIQDYKIVNGFLGCLEAQGSLSTFVCSEPKVAMTLIAEFYHSMDRPSKSFVQGLVDGRQFHITAHAISEFLGVLNDGDVTYSENVNPDILFRRYIPAAEFNGSVFNRTFFMGWGFHHD